MILISIRKPAWPWWAAGAAALSFFAQSASAAEAGDTSHASIAVFLTQIIVLVLVGRLIGEGLQRFGQPNVMGPLIGGLILGPSVFGAFWPELQHALFPAAGEQKAMLTAVSQIGILLLLFLAGMETDIGLIRRVGRAAVSVSATGIIVPFACGFALGEFLPASMLPDPDQRIITSLFLGTALSISSVKIVAMVVREMGFVRRNLGQIILASAVIDDTIGWVIIAVTFGLAGAQTLNLMSLGGTVFGTLLFLVLSLTIGRRIVFRIIQLVNDHFVSEVPVISAVLIIMLAMALITNAIGVHDVLGAFVAGILVGQSPIMVRQIDDQLRGITTGLFMPIFFGLSGLGADLTILANPTLLGLTAGIVLIASIGKFGGAFLGAALGRLNRHEALALGLGMNARGSTEVIVATIGLSMGALTHDLFTMIVAMAIITTMIMPPTLRWALRRLPLTPDEEKRLAHEEFRATAFLGRLERFLLAVDDSPKGLFASRIAGLLAGPSGKPVTALRVPTHNSTAEAEPETVVAEGAARGRQATVGEAFSLVPEVDVTAVKAPDLDEETVASEAKKGYDLLMIGLDPTVGTKGGFSRRVSRAARGFAGPLVIASAQGIHSEDPLGGPLDILLPVTGTAATAAAAEVAFALAQASGGSVMTLYIAPPRGNQTWHPLSEQRRRVRALLRDLDRVAQHHGMELRSNVQTSRNPEIAILRQARRGRHTLIVMGVNRRTGDVLSFGETAQLVLESADRSVLLVSTGV
jgi:Kef-type K+ transport system membrane component KefB/nucleotide-binding universal stress UspA family protein